MSTSERRMDEELMSRPEQEDDREHELVDLIRIDYDAALRAIAGFVGTSAHIRAIGIAVWGVVIGVAVRDESALLAGVALALIVVFAYGDAYHAALYRRALARAISIESLLDSYLERLGVGADDPDVIFRVRAKLETHRFGFHRTLKPPKLPDLLTARPRVVFSFIYPMIALLTIVLIIVYTF